MYKSEYTFVTVIYASNMTKVIEIRVIKVENVRESISLYTYRRVDRYKRFLFVRWHSSEFLLVPTCNVLYMK
jgi:hypothetical protein